MIQIVNGTKSSMFFQTKLQNEKEIDYSLSRSYTDAPLFSTRNYII